MKITPIKLLGVIAFSAILMSAKCGKCDVTDCGQPTFCLESQQWYYQELVNNSCNAVAIQTIEARDAVKEYCPCGDDVVEMIRDACNNQDEIDEPDYVCQ